MTPNTTDTDDYIVTCDCCELPRGSHFTLWPAEDVEPGQLALIETAKGRKLIGRWFSPEYVAARSAGRFSIGVLIQPERMVIDPRNEARLLGAVIPAENPPAQSIAALPEADIERMLNPFPRRFAC